MTLISAKDAQGKEACPDVLLTAGVTGRTYDVSGFLYEHAIAIAISQIDIKTCGYSRPSLPISLPSTPICLSSSGHGCEVCFVIDAGAYHSWRWYLHHPFDGTYVLSNHQDRDTSIRMLTLKVLPGVSVPFRAWVTTRI